VDADRPTLLIDLWNLRHFQRLHHVDYGRPISPFGHGPRILRAPLERGLLESRTREQGPTHVTVADCPDQSARRVTH
jgi:hypothetical protein